MKKPGISHLLLATNGILLAALAWTSARSQPQPPIHDVVRARLFELVNERGEMRAQIHLGENGAGQMRMRSGDGEIRVKFGGTDDGAILLMMDGATEPAVRLSSNGATPVLKLTSAQRERVVEP
jgi:hypothetical protein